MHTTYARIYNLSDIYFDSVNKVCIHVKIQKNLGVSFFLVSFLHVRLQSIDAMIELTNSDYSWHLVPESVQAP